MPTNPVTTKSPDALHATGPVVFFDGECAFCNRAVLFIVARDQRKRFRFAPLQSALGQRVMLSAGLDADQLDTILFVEGDRVFTRSSAALAIASRLSWPWRAASVLRVVPRRLRDATYDAIARNRHRLLPNAAVCALPDVVAGRMIDSA